MADKAINDLFAQYNQKLSNVMPQAVGYNVALFSFVSLATVLVFNILRPRNKIVYEPKTKYYEGDKRPPKINDGFFSWVQPLIHTKEPELVDKIGLDAVTYLRFLRLMRWLFTAVAGLSCAALLPLDYLFNVKNIESDNRNILAMLTIQNLYDWHLFIHVAAEYIFTFMVLGFVWWHWREMVKLRHQWFRSDEYSKSFYARTLMITHVAKNHQKDETLKSLLDSLKVPYPTTAVHIGRRVGQLPDLIEFHNQTVRDLELVLVRYLKGGRIGKKRPTITIGGFMGFGGQKKDAIDYYTAKLKKCEEAVETWRSNIDLGKTENYGFASMAAVPYAHIVAKMLNNRTAKGMVITLAPNPKDIIWKNLNMSDAARSSLQMMGWIWLAVVCFLNTIPLLFISMLANLTALTQYVPFLDAWSQSSPQLFSLVAGILPPTIMALFGFILPKIMRKLSKYQGAITRTRLDRAVVARYFAFLIISQLFIFSLIGVGFQTGVRVVGMVRQHKSVSVIMKEFEKLPGNIQASYLEQSSYWLTFFPLRGFLAVFDLAQLINLFYIWIMTHIFGRTPRDIREWTQPPAFEFPIYYSNMLFMAAVALVYAPLAPLVPLAAAVVFWVSSIVYKYQLMFVFVSKVESGGRLWNPVVNRLLVSTFFMHALVTLTVGLQMGWMTFYWVSALPPALIVILFKVYLRRFDNQFRYFIPTDSEIAQSRIHNERSDIKNGKLEKRFGHPALHVELFTPMLHQKMIPLLSEVYHGRLGHSETKMAEYGGQKLETTVAPGGIKIAGIAQSELEYDLAMYQRDRGELDSDTRSLGSSTLLGDGGSTYSHGQPGMRPTGYDAYMAHGPAKTAEEMEMSRLSSRQRDDFTPLLPPGQGFSGQQSQRSYSPHPPSMQGYPPPHLVDPNSTPYASQERLEPMHPVDPYDRRFTQSPPQGYGQPYPPSNNPSTQSFQTHQPRQSRGW